MDSLPSLPQHSLPAGLTRLSDTLWELPIAFKRGMRVPARIYATEALLRRMDFAVFDQIANVATLPGIVKYAFCMPDGHSGYGFPIGGVAAMDPRTGVISPGGIGFDINCGMRLAVTSLTLEQVQPRLHELIDGLYRRVPSGVGGRGSLRLRTDDFLELARTGSRWCLKNGYATAEDLALTEDGGCAEGADTAFVSDAAIGRGQEQLGTLGSGNHYLELQVARPENIRDPATASAFGFDRPNQIAIMFHCGSRGFGHQIASDYLKSFSKVMGPKFGISVDDRELACAPFDSPEGQAYFSAMKCAINMSFANRQLILHRVREVFSDVFGKPAEELGLRMVYDVAHNTAKLETHVLDGHRRELLVHRKGATRALGPDAEGLPGPYRKLGQPVIIGGSMETGSYLLVGVRSGLQTFFSTAHGSGRLMSRSQAKKLFQGGKLSQSMLQRGIYVKTASLAGLAEEAGGAYKDIDEVIALTAEAGLSRPVVKLVPIGNVKG